jgi:hypothetical protein
MRASWFAVATLAALLLGALPLVAAHGGDEFMDASPAAEQDDKSGHNALSYFRYGHYTGWIMAHIVLNMLAWIIIMPVAIFLSVARSRYHLPAQVVFHVVNGLAVFTGFVYNHSTPDLWEHNSHHPIGWVVTSFAIVWTVMSLYTAYSDYKSKRTSLAQRPSSSQYQRVQQEYHDGSPSSPSSPRWRDSGLGSRQNSSDSVYQKPEDPETPMQDPEHGEDDDDEEPEKRGFLGNNRFDRFMARYVKRFSSTRAVTVVRGSQIFLDKVLMLLGFLGLCSGFLIYGGLSRNREVFSILAHFIKGGIFFWYGLLTLGRWMGAFTEFGWAWNIRPSFPLVERWKTRIPSAEFVESFVIWLYGASNVFLEHLNNWGGKWSAQDFEHVSITILFFGGGLLGMVIESPWLRKYMNTTVVDQKSKDEELAVAGGASRFAAQRGARGDLPAELPAANVDLQQPRIWEEPATYKVPLNPMPAVVIMSLGLMMSAHHQNSMVSTMMHSMWGSLFTGFALARGATYVLLYLKPPTSHFPARPPSELVAAYCLSFGGIMFMMSGHDTIWAIESNGLDAMTIFTITAGLSAIILAWAVVCFAIKGWAVRKERAAAGRALS